MYSHLSLGRCHLQVIGPWTHPLIGRSLGVARVCELESAAGLVVWLLVSALVGCLLDLHVSRGKLAVGCLRMISVHR